MISSTSSNRYQRISSRAGQKNRFGPKRCIHFTCTCVSSVLRMMPGYSSWSYLSMHHCPTSSGLPHWISFSGCGFPSLNDCGFSSMAGCGFPSLDGCGFPSLVGCGTAVGTFWPKLKHCVLKHLQLNCCRVVHMQLTSRCISSPGARVITWWILIVPGTAGICFGIFFIALSISSLFTKNSFTVVFVSVKALNNSCASGISRPFATIMSAVLFNAPPTPSGAPLPWLASKKIQEPALNPLLSNSVLKRKKLPRCLYCVQGPSLKKCSTDTCGYVAWR